MSYSGHSAPQQTDVTVNYDTASGTTIFAAKTGMRIIRVIPEVTVTWDDGSPVFTIGDAGETDGFVEDIGGDLGATGYYNLDHDTWGEYIWHQAGTHTRDHIYESDTDILFTGDGNGDGGSQGVTVVHIVWQYI